MATAKHWQVKIPTAIVTLAEAMSTPTPSYVELSRHSTQAAAEKSAAAWNRKNGRPFYAASVLFDAPAEYHAKQRESEEMRRKWRQSVDRLAESVVAKVGGSIRSTHSTSFGYSVYVTAADGREIRVSDHPVGETRRIFDGMLHIFDAAGVEQL